MNKDLQVLTMIEANAYANGDLTSGAPTQFAFFDGAKFGYSLAEKGVVTVFYNHGDHPIFICTQYDVDPNGGPAIPKTTHCVRPGGGIDLTILGLYPNKPVSELAKDNFGACKG